MLKRIHKHYNKIKVSSYIFVLIVNLLAIIFYTQAPQGDPDSATSTLDTTHSWVYLAQKVIGGLIILHGIIIVVFDLYRDIPAFSEVRRLKGFWQGLKALFIDRENILYYFIYIGIAALGIFSPGFFALLMNDILNINAILRNIVKSVWRPRTSIILTMVLFVVIMYAMASIGFVLFSGEYANSMPNQVPCKNIWEVFLLTFDKGMKFDGGIGNYLDDHNENLDSSGEYIPVRIYKFLFSNFLLIIDFIIVLSIVTGTIIDTFGSLREEYNAYIEDSETFCFICGHDRETLDKESDQKNGFEYHVKQEHYQWNYLFYIGYLTDKEDTELTGLESYIDDLINEENIDWFPNHRALMIHEEEGLEAGEAIDCDMKDIEKNVALIYLVPQD